MDRFLKTLLLWLLMLALPVQGFAMAAGNSCGPAHRHYSSAPVAHHHDADMHDVQHHHHMQAATDHAHADASQASANHAGANCCAGAVMLPSMVTWNPVYQRIAFAFASPASLFSGYIPDGLKRPPRSFLV